MKAPSRNVSASLNAQSVGGRSPEPVNTSGKASSARPSMVVPGEGMVQDAPKGANSPQHGRSACNYTAPMKRYGGG